MQHSEKRDKADTVTFRLDSALKAELTQLAEDTGQSLGELLREMARERVDQERRRAMHAEARRQSMAIAERARDPNTDEYAMMRELEAEVANVADEWNE